MQYYFLILGLIHLIKCELEPLVMYGEPANIQQFPHVASLSVKCQKGNGWSCGSSILNQRILLTAAHCVIGCYDKDTKFVKLGNSNKKNGIMSTVVSVRAHENFDREIYDYDIALMKLKTNLRFGSNIRRVSLMVNPPYYETAQIAGWGFDVVSKNSLKVFI